MSYNIVCAKSELLLKSDLRQNGEINVNEREQIGKMVKSSVSLCIDLYLQFVGTISIIRGGTDLALGS